jgi:hypothetical protein
MVVSLLILWCSWKKYSNYFDYSLGYDNYYYYDYDCDGNETRKNII